MGDSRNAYRVLVGRPEGKRPLRRQRRRWEDHIKMDLREVGYDDRSELLIKKIRREGVCAGDEKLESPEKNRPRELLIIVDDVNRCILRRKIQEFYTVQKEVSTLKKLLKLARGVIISNVGEKNYGNDDDDDDDDDDDSSNDLVRDSPQRAKPHYQTVRLTFTCLRRGE
ncbi:hypothetical protein ANN_09570 [Periplaneta americana]|uniref:Uncharacterized protein n=1 Tax=Periplaneta americana TaxID=6978 RepID=A0ABQ8TMP3_PERAM|nr:hypothetical protein ANN_09570 [Periplaneta americana]